MRQQQALGHTDELSPTYEIPVAVLSYGWDVKSYVWDINGYYVKQMS